MSATRLLILGVLREQPRHGYEVRQELERWGVEQWANVAFGSIYFALGKMADEGLVEVVSADPQRGKRPARTVYAVTELGQREFERLLREFWWQYKPTIDPFQVALTFMNCLPRDELVVALRARATSIRCWLEAQPFLVQAKLSSPRTPRHVAENLRLATAHVETELRWIEETIGKVERGELP